MFFLFFQLTDFLLCHTKLHQEVANSAREVCLITLIVLWQHFKRLNLNDMIKSETRVQTFITDVWHLVFTHTLMAHT